MPHKAPLEITGFGVNSLDDTAFTADAVADTAFGKVVQRASATLPQTTAAAIFTVAGGRVLVTQIVGEVTVVIQTQANNTKLVANPTVGADVDLCAVLNISADAVGELYAITGTLSDAMVSGMAVKAQVAPVVVKAGTIDLNCAASNTGEVKWTLRYIPLDAGATVTAA